MKEEKSIETKMGEIIVTLDYIKRDIVEIKSDIKDQKQSYVTRAEFEDATKTHGSFVTRGEFDPYKKSLIAVATAVVLAVVNSILELIKLK